MPKPLQEMSKDEMVDLLRTDVGEWNRLRAANKSARIDFSHQYLVEENLENANLSKLDLTEARFNGGRLENVDFRESILRSTSFRNCDLTYSNFSDTRLHKTDFYEARISHSKFIKAVGRSYFDRADLQGAHLNGAHLDKCSFMDANLLQDRYD